MVTSLEPPPVLDLYVYLVVFTVVDMLDSWPRFWQTKQTNSGRRNCRRYPSGSHQRTKPSFAGRSYFFVLEQFCEQRPKQKSLFWIAEEVALFSKEEVSRGGTMPRGEKSRDFFLYLSLGMSVLLGVSWLCLWCVWMLAHADSSEVWILFRRKGVLNSLGLKWGCRRGFCCLVSVSLHCGSKTRTVLRGVRSVPPHRDPRFSALKFR